MTKHRLVVKADDEGKIHLDVPAEPPGGEFDVIVTVKRRPTAGEETPESRGWPPGFLEQTYGSITDPAFRRYPQGEYEKRLELE